MASVQKISPFLMFDGPVEEAAKFYVSVFCLSLFELGDQVGQSDGGHHRGERNRDSDVRWRAAFQVLVANLDRAAAV